ncbi:diguanylate cyclase [Beijerinckia sp. L45]|uniref:GGDEF domain-containing protein n=1 Tax=Beijerinckia sp. L45 TaxID=1641855 RepID=UPI00131E77B9|nr:GGDEF domain-containing protein [Beijerinckia sp. L45]
MLFRIFDRLTVDQADSRDAASDAELTAAIAASLSSGKGTARFCPLLAARFETDTRAQRVHHLRRMIWLGVLVSNVYNLSGFITLPHYAWLNLCLRVLLLTPVAIGLSAMVDNVKDKFREGLCAIGMIGTTGIPMLLFFLSSDPLAPFTTGEIMLCVLYANTTMPLRFPWACIVSATVLVALAACVCSKPELGWGLSAAIMLNMMTTVIYSLAANYRIERSERRDYLLTLRETLRVSSLTADNTALTQLSTTDALTGLSNRRFLEDRTNAFDHAIVQGRHMAVIIVDVDHFKTYNDFYGHRAGDECLRQLAAVFRQNRRDETDVTVRYGGEEFVVVLQDRSTAEAMIVAERLRLSVQILALPHENRSDGVPRVSISLGVAGTDLCTGLALSALIESADTALYQAKSAGRNRVQHATGSTSAMQTKLETRLDSGTLPASVSRPAPVIGRRRTEEWIEG